MDLSALKQKYDVMTILYWKAHAIETYPELEPCHAWRRFLRRQKLTDVFFWNECGERCVWRSGKCLKGQFSLCNIRS